MTKIDRILHDEAYRAAAEKVRRLEADRIFCRHGLEHSLDVARIGWILALEENINVPKELIYGAALIHDIGRGEEYETGESHDTASVRLGRPVLERAGFSEKDIKTICEAILSHRQSKKENANSFSALEELLYRADKLSRPCFMCRAAKLCYWDRTKKNETLFT